LGDRVQFGSEQDALAKAVDVHDPVKHQLLQPPQVERQHDDLRGEFAGTLE
jgi:hypothetical protein